MPRRHDSVIDAGLSLLEHTPNRLRKDGNDSSEGIIDERLPEFSLDMDNEDIIDLFQKRKLKWDNSDVKTIFSRQGEENERYILGDQFEATKLDIARPDVDNVLFEAMTTWLPEATKRNPEPTVTLSFKEEEDDETREYTKFVIANLAEIADTTKLKLELKQVALFQELYMIGVVKMGWDGEEDIPSVDALRPEKLILDPDATISRKGYTGKFIGEMRTMESGDMLNILESNDGESDGIALINELIEKEEGTVLKFIEWWENGFFVWTMGTTVLLKIRNIHWDYGVEAQPEKRGKITGKVKEEEVLAIEGVNHFKAPRMPYVFLSIFNLGKQPVDETTNITQNLANQDRVNSRNRQINKNVRKMNGGTIVSLANSGLERDKIANVTRAEENGGTIAIPKGDPKTAITHIQRQGLPSDVFNDRDDMRNRIRDIWGTRGISTVGSLEDKTVRGKFANAQRDGSRIGGGFSQNLEQFADDIFNWMVQLLYVYDDTYIALGPDRPIIRVSVKENSMLPKDAATIAQQAVELTTAGLMSPLDLYKRLDDPNPEETAANAWLQVNAPELLYGNDPRVAQVMKQRAEAAGAGEQKPPSVSIGFADLPPEGQAQAAKLAGINLNAEAIAAFNKRKNDDEDTREAVKVEAEFERTSALKAAEPKPTS